MLYEVKYGHFMQHLGKNLQLKVCNINVRFPLVKNVSEKVSSKDRMYFLQITFKT